MNKILISIAAFLFAFTAGLWILFPYQTLINNIISKTESNLRMDIEWQGASSGIFSTDYTGVTVNGSELGDVSISHSPLKLFTGRVGVTIKGIYETEAVLSRSAIVFDMETTGKALDFIREPVTLEGTVRISGSMDPMTGSSDIKGEFEKMVMKSPIGEMVFENVQADITKENRLIRVNSLISGGKNELDLKGTVRLMGKPADSDVNLAGSIRFMGKRKHLTLKGSAANLHPLLD